MALASPAATSVAHAFTPEFSSPATLTITQQEEAASYRLPIGRWVEATGVPTRLLTGLLDQTAWRIDAAEPATLPLADSLRAQLLRDGWRLIYECETAACGGYDFRYGTSLLPEPEMHVDLGDFRYIAAEKGDEALSLMISRATAATFVQLTRVAAATGPTPAPEPVVGLPDPGPKAAPTPVKGSLGERLEAGGAVVMEDLIFASGAAELAAGDYASLAELASYLAAHPDRSVVVVGHTDASGGLAANVALSRQRAQSVRARLTKVHGVPSAQVQAEGVGYLAPRDSNLTPEGRTRNRRVEVMLTSTK